MTAYVFWTYATGYAKPEKLVKLSLLQCCGSVPKKITVIDVALASFDFNCWKWKPSPCGKLVAFFDGKTPRDNGYCNVVPIG